MKENGELYNRENAGKVAMNERNVNERKWRDWPLATKARCQRTYRFHRNLLISTSTMRSAVVGSARSPTTRQNGEWGTENTE